MANKLTMMENIQEAWWNVQEKWENMWEEWGKYERGEKGKAQEIYVGILLILLVIGYSWFFILYF